MRHVMSNLMPRARANLSYYFYSSSFNASRVQIRSITRHLTFRINFLWMGLQLQQKYASKQLNFMEEFDITTSWVDSTII